MIVLFIIIMAVSILLPVILGVVSRLLWVHIAGETAVNISQIKKSVEKQAEEKPVQEEEPTQEEKTEQ